MRLALTPSLLRNPVTFIGAVVTTVSAVLFAVVFLLDLLGFHTNPYIGIVFFLVFPGLFVFGLVLMPVGAWIEQTRRRLGKTTIGLRWPVIDLNDPRQLRAVTLISAATLANVVIVSVAAYRGIEYMDSVPFCGQVCHQVMDPEFTAFQAGPHARVTCVQCHIGPGAPWFVRSKLSGTRQVFAVMFNTYSRPIASPVEDLRPARDTCEQCHWPAKFHGDTVVVRHEYAEDEANTDSATTIRLHVGSGGERSQISGIHWHVGAGNEIDYITTDQKRAEIPYVSLKTADGTVREFVVDGVSPDQLAAGERRRMDCMDCHNRPSHPFAASAARAVDEAMGFGTISASLPFIKREAVAALTGSYLTAQAADQAIAARLSRFYQTEQSATYQSHRDQVDAAVAAIQRLYRRNVFPEMNVGWGTYVNHVGHNDSPGCFRCHDDNHKSKDGQVIPQDCDLCHTIE